MWIEVHQSLPTHAKTLEAAALLDIAEAQVVGHVVCLWLWALDNSTEGRLRLDRPRVVARAALWTGDPGRFLDALVAAGFLDDDGAIHDWDDYAGRLMERRERVADQTRKRTAAWRERQLASQAGRQTGESGQGDASPTRDVTRNVTRDERVSDAPTGPNRTGPNLTPRIPSSPPIEDTLPSGSVRARGAPRTHAPAAASVRVYRQVTGYAPGPAARARIAAAVPDDADLALWQLVLEEWLSRGHSEKNVVGMLEWFHDGIPATSKPTRRTVSQRSQRSQRPRTAIDAIADELRALDAREASEPGRERTERGADHADAHDAHDATHAPADPAQPGDLPARPWALVGQLPQHPRGDQR